MARPEFNRGIKRVRIVDWPAGADTPDEVAGRATYKGSTQHKTYRSVAGPPARRSDAAKCDKYSREGWPRLQSALRDAILKGIVGDFRGGFPSRVWVYINSVLHEARLTNELTGEYHGFPINDPRQYPEPPERLKETPRVQVPVVRG